MPLRSLFLKSIEGTENIPKKSSFIITSNHESYLDPLLIISVIMPLINKKVHFLAKKGYFWDFFGDRLAKDWLGGISLDDGKEKALEKFVSLSKQGEITAIFIEGTESLDGNLKEGRTGTVRVALKAKIPILPIGLIGTFNIVPGNKLLPKLKRAKMCIGKPIYLDKYYKEKINKKLLRKLTDDVMHVISTLTGKPYNY
ncbi:MAG: lysophospholipid acyltransferase family protein [Candidatus Woesearchaeota archaeon]